MPVDVEIAAYLEKFRATKFELLPRSNDEFSQIIAAHKVLNQIDFRNASVAGVRYNIWIGKTNNALILESESSPYSLDIIYHQDDKSRTIFTSMKSLDSECRATECVVYDDAGKIVEITTRKWDERKQYTILNVEITKLEDGRLLRKEENQKSKKVTIMTYRLLENGTYTFIGETDYQQLIQGRKTVNSKQLS